MIDWKKKIGYWDVHIIFVCKGNHRTREWRLWSSPKLVLSLFSVDFFISLHTMCTSSCSSCNCMQKRSSIFMLWCKWQTVTCTHLESSSAQRVRQDVQTDREYRCKADPVRSLLSAASWLLKRENDPSITPSSPPPLICLRTEWVREGEMALLFPFFFF